ncbi:MAG: trypsin-like serine protease [Lachnospiraceae bacterium]|nr:trypsin-like serine protease [Lachnospiraceae bacterium]
MSKHGFFSKITKCAALALVFGVVGGTAFSGVNYFLGSHFSGADTTALEAESSRDTMQIQPTSTVTNVISKDISNIVEEAMPSVVAITGMTQQEIRSFFGQGQTIESESSGSGVVVNQNEEYLYIATNNHVVEQTDALTVQFSDGSTAPATIRGTDPSDDLAVIQVALSDLTEETLNTVKVASIGNSDELSVGEPAIAIGNALGYGQSVTTGVISALGKEVTFQNESTGEAVISRLIQTDAAINPGNSGGALLNAEGKLIGINSSKYADTEVEGMGFAIPISTAQPILEDLIANGETTVTGTPYIGIYGVDVTDEVSSQYQMPGGVYVAQVIEGSGAQIAGIVTGNIITKVEDNEITTMEELKRYIGEYKVGDTVTVTVQIANSGAYIEKEIPVTLTSKTN